MPQMKNKPTISTILSPKYIITIFALLAGLMISSAVIELRQSKAEMLQLMKNQSHLLLETLITSSQNILKTNEILENELTNNLLNNAHFLKYLYEKGELSNPFLAEMAKENQLFRIHIISKNGQKIYSSHSQTIPDDNISSQYVILKPIFTGESDTLIIGLRESVTAGEFRFAIALATRQRDAIVINLDARELLNFRRSVGFGKLLQKLIDNPGITYTALQDTSGILAASGNVTELERMSTSPFLMTAFSDSLFQTRIHQFGDLMVYEAVLPFYYYNVPVGLYRMGLSLESLNHINQRIYRRLIIISILLTFVGSIIFFLIISRQNLTLIEKQVASIETYSGQVIDNVSDAILVLNSENKINKFNRAFSELFEVSLKQSEKIPVSTIFNSKKISEINGSSSTILPIQWEINGQFKDILISKSTFFDENDYPNTILVFRDMTRIRELEQQVERNERLSAMGALASGVAHEIRNPLNTISTIIQQLDIDFNPQENSEEYHKLAKLVNGEVKRINNTIQEFLRFSRPEPLHLSTFMFSDLLEEITQQYLPLCKRSSILLQIKSDIRENVTWDYSKIKQVFMNLFQNSIDAMKGGNIEIIAVFKKNKSIRIDFKDDGPGIPETILPQIFNLYFTTKARGTGIGLSIIQKIINEHGGTVSVTSRVGQGTNFVLQLPIQVEIGHTQT